jgi:hypothetical protein
MVMPRCREEEPALTVLPGGRTVACHLHGPAATPELVPPGIGTGPR